MRMPFGQYAGLELIDIPPSYLRWLRRRPWLGKWLAEEIDAVLSGRTVSSPDESFEEVLNAVKESDDGERISKAPTKLKEWRCSCTTVRAAVPVDATCNKCGSEFTLQNV
jgi:hypothetical protein